MDARNSLTPSWKSDLWRIAFVMLIGLGIRFWIVSHTEVAARDSIGFIRYALHLEHPLEGLTTLDVLRKELHPPGYSALILVVSWPVRSIMGGTTAEAMVLSTQIVSVLSCMLLAIPMYYLGRILFERQSAFIGAAIFQVLPVCAQITSDGLSDGLFLLTASTTLWFGVRAFQKPTFTRFLWCGIGSGFAYLIRPEGLILATAVGMVLLGSKLFNDLRWRPMFRNGIALTFGVLLCAGPYIAIIGKLTNKTTGNGLIEMIKGEDPGQIWKARPEEHGSLTTGTLFAAWWNDAINKDDSRMIWALKSLSTETFKTFHYLAAFLAVIGIWFCRKRICQEASMALLMVLASLHAALLLFMATKIGYVSERHTLLIVLIGCIFAGAAIPMIIDRVLSWIKQRQKDPTQVPLMLRIQPTGWVAVWLLLIVGISLPGALKPLHENRAGHHSAGIWLAKNAKSNDMIWDPFCWAEFYAGRTMYSEPVRDYSRTDNYVILEPNNPNPHSKLPLIPLAKKIAAKGDWKVVYQWPENVSVEKAKVLIYRSPPIREHIPN
jgi:hypothetical protein